MAFCNHCGKEISSDASVCVNCGRELSASKPVGAKPLTKEGFKEKYKDDFIANRAIHAGLQYLCALLPIIGIILAITWKESKPFFVKSCRMGTLTGVILWGLVIMINVL